MKYVKSSTIIAEGNWRLDYCQRFVGRFEICSHTIEMIEKYKPNANTLPRKKSTE